MKSENHYGGTSEESNLFMAGTCWKSLFGIPEYLAKIHLEKAKREKNHFQSAIRCKSSRNGKSVLSYAAAWLVAEALSSILLLYAFELRLFSFSSSSSTTLVPASSLMMTDSTVQSIQLLCCLASHMLAEDSTRIWLVFDFSRPQRWTWLVNCSSQLTKRWV